MAFVKHRVRATICFSILIFAALVLRTLVWLISPESTRKETEVIFIFLVGYIFVAGLLFIRYVESWLMMTGVVAIAALILSSALGALIQSVGAKTPGGTAPVIFYFHQPVQFQPRGRPGTKDEIRVNINFPGASTAFETLLAKVARGELELYLRVQALCKSERCEMSVVYPNGEAAKAARRPFDFEIRFPNEHPLIRDLSATLTLVFTFSDDITLYARDIGSVSKTRTDRLFHNGEELSLSHDRLLFVRFMFLDKAGKPHSAIY